MAIYYNSGTASNLQDLLNKLKIFLNYRGWNDEIYGTPPGQSEEYHFCVRKIINNQTWYWWFTSYGETVYHFYFSYLDTINLNLRLEQQPNIVLGRVGLYYDTPKQHLNLIKSASFNYYFIYNDNPPGENLIGVLYQYPYFFTFYLGYFYNSIPIMSNINHILCHDIVVPYYNNAMIAYQIYPPPPVTYYHTVYINSTQKYNLTYICNASGRPSFGKGHFFQPRILPQYPVLQPCPIYTAYLNGYSLIGYLKDIYVCWINQQRPFIQSYGGTTYLFVPIKNDTNNYSFGELHWTKEMSYAIKIA